MGRVYRAMPRTKQIKEKMEAEKQAQGTPAEQLMATKDPESQLDKAAVAVANLVSPWEAVRWAASLELAKVEAADLVPHKEVLVKRLKDKFWYSVLLTKQVELKKLLF